MFSCFKDKTFLSKFIKIALPVMLSGFVTFLVSFLDNIMVGTVSNEAVSGVYAANQVTYLYNLAIFGLLEGAGVFIQQFTGKKDYDRIRDCYRFKIISSFIFLLIIIPIIYIFGHHLVWQYCKSDTNRNLIFNEAMDYLRLIAISYIPFTIGYIYSTTYREMGLTKYAMYSSIVALVVNTILNLVFILGLKQGAKGAAYATIISRICEMLFLIGLSRLKKFLFFRNAFKPFKFEKGIVKKILSKSYLLFINEIGFALGNILQTLAFSQRDGVLAAISVLTTISNIITILIQGLSVGIGVIVGQDLGQGDFVKARDDNKKLSFLGIYLSLFTGLILVATSFVLPNIFKEIDNEQKKIATKLIIIYGVLLFANCLSIIYYYTLKAGGRTFETLILDTGFMLVVYVPVSWILAMATNLNIIYIYLIVRGLDILKSVLGFILVKRGKWLQNLTIEDASTVLS
jgi:putative MATE family efflux protein